jgi:hypothetical protein
MRESLHASIWRHLPHTWRRHSLTRLTQALALRPTRVPYPSDRVIVAGYLRAGSGLARQTDHRLLVLELPEVPDHWRVRYSIH